MTAILDKESVREAYNDVRSDDSETNWVVLKNEGSQIVVDSTGESYDEFFAKFTDDMLGFGYVRIFTGDELSRRAKFALITWIGQNVSPLKKAKMSTNKAFVKEVIHSYAKEILVEDSEDLNEEGIRELLVKAGGANYGTGA
ncbi:coactosin-like protein [Liolophura sinensis]|uniref:coactosin-like protein n=1 Tax=Liolophura sinensis TaxID=3198878 RepID=UPI003158D573